SRPVPSSKTQSGLPVRRPSRAKTLTIRKLCMAFSIRGHGAVARPLAQARDLLGADHRERSRGTKLLEDMPGLERRLFGVRAIGGGHDRLLDLGAGESLGCRRERV